MLDVFDRFCDGGSGGGSSSINIDGDNDAAASSYPTRCDTDIYMAHRTTKSQQQKQTESKSTGWVNAFILFTIKWMDDGALDTRTTTEFGPKKYSCISDALAPAPAPQWAIKNCIVIAMQWDFLWIYFSWDCALVSIKTKDGGSDSNNDNDSIQLTQHQLEMESRCLYVCAFAMKSRKTTSKKWLHSETVIQRNGAGRKRKSQLPWEIDCSAKWLCTVTQIQLSPQAALHGK